MEACRQLLEGGADPAQLDIQLAPALLSLAEESIRGQVRLVDLFIRHYPGRLIPKLLVRFPQCLPLLLARRNEFEVLPLISYCCSAAWCKGLNEDEECDGEVLAIVLTNLEQTGYWGCLQDWLLKYDRWSVSRISWLHATVRRLKEVRLVPSSVLTLLMDRVLDMDTLVYHSLLSDLIDLFQPVCNDFVERCLAHLLFTSSLLSPRQRLQLALRLPCVALVMLCLIGVSLEADLEAQVGAYLQNHGNYEEFAVAEEMLHTQTARNLYLVSNNMHPLVAFWHAFKRANASLQLPMPPAVPLDWCLFAHLHWTQSHPMAGLEGLLGLAQSRPDAANAVLAILQPLIAGNNTLLVALLPRMAGVPAWLSTVQAHLARLLSLSPVAYAQCLEVLVGFESRQTHLLAALQGCKRFLDTLKDLKVAEASILTSLHRLCQLRVVDPRQAWERWLKQRWAKHPCHVAAFIPLLVDDDDDQCEDAVVREAIERALAHLEETSASLAKLPLRWLLTLPSTSFEWNPRLRPLFTALIDAEVSVMPRTQFVQRSAGGKERPMDKEEEEGRLLSWARQRCGLEPSNPGIPSMSLTRYSLVCPVAAIAQSL